MSGGVVARGRVVGLPTQSREKRSLYGDNGKEPRHQRTMSRQCPPSLDEQCYASQNREENLQHCACLLKVVTILVVTHKGASPRHFKHCRQSSESQ